MRPIQLYVDITEASRSLSHVKADLPVVPGRTARFVMPLWLPESHVPNGPVAAIAGLYFGSNRGSLTWRRDPDAAYIYEVDIPQDVHTVHASFDAILQDFRTRRIVVLKWETVLLHHENISVRDLQVQATVAIPAGWGHASALENDGMEVTVGDAITTLRYAQVTVNHLQDSPILAGQHFNQISTTPDDKHILALACSEQGDRNVPAAIMAKFKRLVNEAQTIFGAVPYRTFRFLVVSSDLVALPGYGLGGMEHCESCLITTPSKYLTSTNSIDQGVDVFCHEFIHAWNGKYRRPAGHIPDHFNTPLHGKLLWVYEGLTQYYGNVIAVRSGFLLPSMFRTKLAEIASNMASQAGRVWNSTENTSAGTSVGIGLGKNKPRQWDNWMRWQDFYFEGVLVWLEVDTVIRDKSSGRRTLDDFARAFFHKREDDGGVDAVAYTLQDIVATLDRVMPHDWAAFFQQRVQEIEAHVNIRGIERAGYDFEYSEESYESQDTDAGHIDAIWSSIGLRVGNDGYIADVRRFGPADVAKLPPQGPITHVGGVEFSVEALLSRVRLTKEQPHSVTLRIKLLEDTWDATIEYDGGIRYAKLRRRADGTDMLAAIMAPRTDV